MKDTRFDSAELQLFTTNTGLAGVAPSFVKKLGDVVHSFRGLNAVLVSSQHTPGHDSSIVGRAYAARPEKVANLATQRSRGYLDVMLGECCVSIGENELPEDAVMFRSSAESWEVLTR